MPRRWRSCDCRPLPWHNPWQASHRVTGSPGHGDTGDTPWVSLQKVSRCLNKAQIRSSLVIHGNTIYIYIYPIIYPILSIYPIWSYMYITISYMSELSWYFIWSSALFVSASSPGLGACVVNWSSFLTPQRRQQLKSTVLRYAEPCEHLSPELQEPWMLDHPGPSWTILWQRDQQNQQIYTESTQHTKLTKLTKASVRIRSFDVHNLWQSMTIYDIRISCDGSVFGFVLEELCKDLNSMDFEGSPKVGRRWTCFSFSPHSILPPFCFYECTAMPCQMPMPCCRAGTIPLHIPSEMLNTIVKLYQMILYIYILYIHINL